MSYQYFGRLTDGFPTVITFDKNPSVKFFEKEVTPPSVDGGGANDITTMHNTAYRTNAPKRLKTLGSVKLSAAYDTSVYKDIMAMLQINQKITITFSDNSTVVFYGWIDKFTPGSIKEGAQPLADVEIACSNMNESGVEVGPVHTSGSSNSTGA